MQSIKLILFTVTVQPHTTKAHAFNEPCSVHSNSSTTYKKPIQSINIILFTVTAEAHTTKVHAFN
jgi:hypothetical protein